LGLLLSLIRPKILRIEFLALNWITPFISIITVHNKAGEGGAQ